MINKKDFYNNSVARIKDIRGKSYNSVQEALNDELLYREIGVTVKVITAGKAVEYWFESGIENANLVRKNVGGGDGSGIEYHVFTANEDGLVPAPLGNTTDRVLFENGKWSTPTTTGSLKDLQDNTSDVGMTWTVSVLNAHFAKSSELHSHSNKGVLDNTTASFTKELLTKLNDLNSESYFKISGGTVTGESIFSKNVKMNAGLTVKQLVTEDSVEVHGLAPYIDFHYNNSTSDFTSRIVADNSNGLSIVTTGGEFKVNNNIRASNFFTTSLAKYKTNIEPFKESGLDIINSLDIVKFDRKDTKQKNVIGVIADNENPAILNDDQTAVDNYKTIFLLAKAVQELTDQVNDLTQELSNIKDKLEM